MNKKCVLILPYFGTFNNYFALFLKTIGANRNYDLLLLTDCNHAYAYPSNVRIVRTTLAEIRKIAERKFGFGILLDKPYKLCDYKPMYGFLFEEYIEKYEYWGHCDCDLLFGDLDMLLTPLLNEGYDKLFAAGHLTIYKNSFENNRRFMKSINGVELYRAVLSTDKIMAFDEDYSGVENIQGIFLADGAKVFSEDLSMNTSVGIAKFVRSYYDPNKRHFVKEPYRKARYYWNNGEILSLKNKNGVIVRDYYLYMHFQLRKMRMKRDPSNADIIQILPDRFLGVSKLPETIKELRTYTIGFPYLFPIDDMNRRLKTKIKNLKIKEG